MEGWEAEGVAGMLPATNVKDEAGRTDLHEYTTFP
jgi:hypothetical protein